MSLYFVPQLVVILLAASWRLLSSLNCARAREDVQCDGEQQSVYRDLSASEVLQDQGGQWNWAERIRNQQHLNITPHHTTPHHTTPHHTKSHHISQDQTTQHNTTPHHITPDHTTSHNTTPRHTTSHYTTPHLTTPHHATSHHITPNNITSYHI